MSRLQKGIIFGLVAGILGLILNQLSLGLRFEEDVGLSLLFKLRGTRNPPSDVVIVTMDEEAAQHFNLPTNPEKWPRSLHADLIRKLKADNASVIAFDLFFKEPHLLEEDTAFSNAISDAGNVILSEYLKGKTSKSNMPQYSTEKLIQPIDILKNSAVAHAPLLFPDYDTESSSSKLTKYWTFKESIGNVPTLPVVTLQVLALDTYTEFIQLLKKYKSKLVEKLPKNIEANRNNRIVKTHIQNFRNISLKKPQIITDILNTLEDLDSSSFSVKKKTIIKSLLNMYQGPNSRYINFYGPPGTIETICYHHALGAKDKPDFEKYTDKIKNKAVFIGLSERFRTDQKDVFNTVYSLKSGVDLSGVEIAATAFANLLHNESIRPLMGNANLLFMLSWGVVLGMICYLLSTLYAVVVSVGLGLLYLGFAQFQFNQNALWFPLAIPLFFQTPVAFFGTVLWKLRETKKEGQHIQETLRKFLPADLIGQLDRNMWDFRENNQIVYGICLITDAYQYTTLSETMDPRSLGNFMGRYFESILEPVIHHGGIVTDLKGDSIVAIWKIEKPDAAIRRKACLAALDIDRNMHVFNQSANGHELPTRIGLHIGDMQLRPIGALEYYAYRALGDTVNTAARLEGLNKFLGTQLLVSEEVLQQLDGILARNLGAFLFQGKTNPITVYELFGLFDEMEETQKELSDRFAAALDNYNNQVFESAKKTFNECLNIQPNDGPSLFYINLCEKYEKNPPRAIWDGVVRLENK